MADVFLSYAREDTARAEQVARGLEAAGLEVFWDNEIPPGATWADHLEQKLNQCKALIVLWSEHSTKSQWVREEARMGRDKNCLIPVMIDNSQPPFGFGEVQAANLAAWNGEADHPHWRRFVDAVMSITQRTPQPRPAPQPAAQPRPAAQPLNASAPAAKKGVPVWVWIAGAVVATIAVLAVIGSMIPDEPRTAGVNPAMPEVQQQQPQQQPQSVGDQNPQQSLDAQLQHAQSVLGQQGYQQVGQPYTGGLQQGEAWNIPAEMQVGYEYQLVGVCDRDCGDLDLRLYGGAGNLIVEDTTVSNQPNVGVIPTTSGSFTIQVHMYNCTVQPCYYAVAMYARPRG